MGSLETGVPLKKGSSFRTQSIGRSERNPLSQRFRSRFSRLLYKKLDYIQWICTVAVFLFFVGPILRFRQRFWRNSGDKLVRRISTGHNQQFGYRKPQLALVFGELLVDSQQLLMVTVAAALLDIGYAIQVYSLEDGPVHGVWKNLGVPVAIIQTCEKSENRVDWLNYDGIFVNSLEAKGVFSCFIQEPFKSLPLIWTIHEDVLAYRSRQYSTTGQIELLNDWKRVFNRSTVIVFPNYALPMIYSTFDAGNFYVLPGSPAKVWEADMFMALDNDKLRVEMGYGPKDIIVAIVGSQFFYKDLCLEHAIILQSLSPLLAEFPQNSDNSSVHLRIIVLSADSSNNYSMALEAIADNLKYPRGVVEHLAEGSHANSVLDTADLVIYGSFLEEQSFPDILLKAMCFGKPIIAPDIPMIRKYVDDKVNGYLYPKENSRILSKIVSEVISKGKISPLARNIASIGRSTAKNLLVLEIVEGYASLLQIILKLPSEVALPKSVSEISPKLKEQWQWHLFEAVENLTYLNRTSRSHSFLDKYEEQWNYTQRYRSGATVAANDSFLYSIWEEEKLIEMTNKRRRREEEEIKGRTDQSRATWEDVYRNAKRADRSKNDLHERGERELERTGQPLCIYEPYYGEGIWRFLHHRSLYRGIGLSTKGRRPGADDIDAPSRLPLLSNPYYRDILGEYGAFFAIANRIDSIHKNAWIGFQSWRAIGRKVSLSKTAEDALLQAIETRKHGDTLYFWVRRNCKFAFSEALKRMYGIKHDLDSLPPMPVDGDTWSVMQSWALPTRSFLEFVMFSRMFIDALDAQMYEEHHLSGHCYLSLSKDKHCYSRLLELLVNVWAYHSARRMVYLNPETGLMQEQHKFKNRRGKMWIKWFSYSTLKSMDEDLAETSDSEDASRRWLWPLTGEVFWHGIFERERNLRHREKEKRKQKSREKLTRMRNRHRQKVIGKYVKPPPEEVESLNTSMLTSRLA
ncbi:glycosyl transferase family 1 protein [Quillaja saponaria]|uniref:Glycosyl transferase family 1 protein n=1 Tax=Quillaja saponaria TaxID=32244 RepID=A0AAD7L5H1_QUISA|nr:glycosyl transferase family 1 protein [Quillaja saponaria]